MDTAERPSVVSPAFKPSLEDCPLDAAQAMCPTFRLYGADAGQFLLVAAICWGLAPLLVMGLLLAMEAARLIRDPLGMAGPGGVL